MTARGWRACGGRSRYLGLLMVDRYDVKDSAELEVPIRKVKKRVNVPLSRTLCPKNKRNQTTATTHTPFVPKNRDF